MVNVNKKVAALVATAVMLGGGGFRSGLGQRRVRHTG